VTAPNQYASVRYLVDDVQAAIDSAAFDRADVSSSSECSRRPAPSTAHGWKGPVLSPPAQPVVKSVGHCHKVGTPGPPPS
jgi:hypothetical protein